MWVDLSGDTVSARLVEPALPICGLNAPQHQAMAKICEGITLEDAGCPPRHGIATDARRAARAGGFRGGAAGVQSALPLWSDGRQARGLRFSARRPSVASVAPRLFCAAAQ